MFPEQRLNVDFATYSISHISVSANSEVSNIFDYNTNMIKQCGFTTADCPFESPILMSIVTALSIMPMS